MDDAEKVDNDNVGPFKSLPKPVDTTVPGSNAEDVKQEEQVLNNNNGENNRESRPLQSLFVDPSSKMEEKPQLLENLFVNPFVVEQTTEQTPLLDGPTNYGHLQDFPEESTYTKPTFGGEVYYNIGEKPSRSPIDFTGTINSFGHQWSRLVTFSLNTARHACSELMQPSTLTGAFLFTLYHTVFSLTMGSSLMRPSTGNGLSLLGLIAKMAAGTNIFGSPIFWILIGEIPAMYPSADLMPAPFMAEMGSKIEAVMRQDPAMQALSPEENDLYYMGSLCFLISVSMIFAGILIVAASVFKLANLGSFLPFPVLAGFFTAVSIMTWKLAFKIDSGGADANVVFLSGDWKWIARCLIHHLPTVLTAVTMKILGPSHPFFVGGLVIASIAGVYLFMAVFGISRDEAVEDGWFWSSSDLVYEPLDAPIGFKKWVPPAPFGWWNAVFHMGYIHYGAVRSGLDTAFVLSILYMIRCSLHCPALRKNVPNLCRPETVVINESNGEDTSECPTNHVPYSPSRPMGVRFLARSFSDAGDEPDHVAISRRHLLGADVSNKDLADSQTVMVNCKPTKYSLQEMMAAYGCAQIWCALFGFVFIIPNLSTSSTMYKVRAEKIAPQFGACLFLLVFYLFGFRFAAYIPKTSFASLLVLAATDMFINFAIKSYMRTREKLEWLVVPLIVILAFVVGLLSAVFLGIAISTFFFVSSFFRSGVVKFMATGAVIRSTVERTPRSAVFLDEHGSLIQVLVLQNYLFFGNASSILTYVGSMFEEPDGIDPAFLLRTPKTVIMDLTLVSGMDTSSVDIFTEMLSLCSNNGCKLFLSGVPQSIRKTMHLGGFKPDTRQDRSRRPLRFFSDLDTAMGKAEDLLLIEESFEDSVCHPKGTGFHVALEHIDQQHQRNCVTALAELECYTERILLEKGEVLYEDVVVDRGLFFIEHGIIKVEQSSHNTMTRSGMKTTYGGHGSLNDLNARALSLAERAAEMAQEKHFRVARMGPGWVLGTGESLTGDANPGQYVAITDCILHHISYQKIEELEESHPVLILKLQKLLAYLMAKRQSITINQLATLHSIMSSPAQKKPLSRARHVATPIGRSMT